MTHAPPTNVHGNSSGVEAIIPHSLVTKLVAIGGYDHRAFLDGIPADAVAELDLGGFTPEEDEATPGATILIDTHAHGISEPVWDLYARAVQRFSNAPTLDGDPSAVAPLLTGGGDPRCRLGIHHRHYVTSLTTALLTRSPATVWLVGSGLVTAAAQGYVAAHPDPSVYRGVRGGFLQWHLGRLALAVEHPALDAELQPGCTTSI